MKEISHTHGTTEQDKHTLDRGEQFISSRRERSPMKGTIDFRLGKDYHTL